MHAIKHTAEHAVEHSRCCTRFFMLVGCQNLFFWVFHGPLRLFSVPHFFSCATHSMNSQKENERPSETKTLGSFQECQQHMCEHHGQIQNWARSFNMAFLHNDECMWLHGSLLFSGTNNWEFSLCTDMTQFSICLIGTDARACHGTWVLNELCSASVFCLVKM